MKITKDMTIGEVVSKFPETAGVFLKLGLHCISCPMSSMETIEQAAESHGIKLNEMLKKLNAGIKKKR